MSTGKRNAELNKLLTACAAGDVGAARHILEQSAPELLNMGFKGKKQATLGVKICAFGSTALIMACKNGNVNLVRLLLDRGANVNACDCRGWTSLMHAAVSKHEAVCVLLAQRQANLMLTSQNSFTAVMYYSMHDSAERKRILSEWQAAATAAVVAAAAAP
jgi:hypothetical protein